MVKVYFDKEEFEIAVEHSLKNPNVDHTREEIENRILDLMRTICDKQHRERGVHYIETGLVRVSVDDNGDSIFIDLRLIPIVDHSKGYDASRTASFEVEE